MDFQTIAVTIFQYRLALNGGPKYEDSTDVWVTMSGSIKIVDLDIHGT